MTRLIDADALHKEMWDKCAAECGYCPYESKDAHKLCGLIDNVPTVEVDKLILIVAKRHGKRKMMLDALIPHGKWVRTALYGQTCLQCNQCGKADFDIKYDKYCPNCGAKMDGGEDGTA